jgi:peptidoglycan-N-acetylglucosamine deacetylase
MSEGWKWDFEDERKARGAEAGSTPAPPPAVAPQAPAAPPAPPERDASARTRLIRVRRRRGIAGVALFALLVLVVALASGSGHHRTPAASSSRGGTRALLPPTPSDSEAAQRTAVASVLAYTPFVKAASTHKREIALTFDDGPGPYTPAVLAVLERMHVRATFFVIGKMLRYFSAASVREINDGDVIGDHTQTHPMLAKLSRHDQFEELFEQIARVELLGGRRPDLFRPPYGSFDATTLAELHRLHLLMVLWSVDTDDYRQPGVSVIVERALAGAQPGAIILMHDAGGAREQTIAALPIVIRRLRARGYRLVTVPELMKDDPPPAGEPLPPNLSGD